MEQVKIFTTGKTDNVNKAARELEEKINKWLSRMSKKSITIVERKLVLAFHPKSNTPYIVMTIHYN
jgi:hypothetical protein